MAMSALEVIIKDSIEANGPMPVSEYMSLCLSHPEHGYYMTRDPFGVKGDFTTAPEISQMFGEMIGIWVLDSWMKMGSPNLFHLVECGPGRGTLMKDLLRATKNNAEFSKAVQIHLMEISPILKKQQYDTLSSDTINWHSDLKTIPQNAPVIFIGNEFLDALPIDQYQFTDAQWHKKYIDLNKNGSFCFTYKTYSGDTDSPILRSLLPPEEGDILEVSKAQTDMMHDFIKIIQKQGGACLFIDYGYTLPSFKDTLQAIMHHNYVEILDEPGEADLTAHINFTDLATILLSENMTLYGPVAQKEFLTALGIEVRADQLRQVSSGRQSENIQLALTRLIGDKTQLNQMGDLFKVMAFTDKDNIDLVGFA